MKNLKLFTQDNIATMENKVVDIPNITVQKGNLVDVIQTDNMPEYYHKAKIIKDSTTNQYTIIPITNVQYNDDTNKDYDITGGTLELNFLDIEKIKMVSIGEEVTDIDINTFNHSSIQTINLNSKITIIKNSTFANCTGLTTVNFTENSQVTNLYDYAFINCTNLETINLPKTLNHIGSSTLANCTKLTTINFEGTIEQYKNISRVNNTWHTNVPVTTVHCIDGDVSIDA